MTKKDEGTHQILIGLFLVLISAILIILGIRALKNR